MPALLTPAHLHPAISAQHEALEKQRLKSLHKRCQSSSQFAKREQQLFSQTKPLPYTNKYGSMLNIEQCRVKPDRFSELKSNKLLQSNFLAEL